MPSSRPKRPQPKHDDPAEPDGDALLPRNTLNGSARAKRKGKDKLADVVVEEPSHGTDDDAAMDLGEPELDNEPEEEQGVTRCICGKTGEDGDETGEFMVQCETCDVWQHGQCMGFPTEADLPPGEYHCELCRPDLHVDRLEKQKERERTRAARLSRSHSPTTLLKPAKRRNTMNSRAADAYDESLKDIIEASALEAQQQHRARSPSAVASPAQDDEPAPPPKNGAAAKKRKRTDDDAPPTKRTRSASTASDRAPLQREREETPASTAAASAPPRSMPPPAPPKPRNKRGGQRKSAKIESTPDIPDGEDAASATGNSSTAGQRRTASARAKANSKRGNAGGGNNERARGGTRSTAQDAYDDGNGHAAAGIGLPDHLAHLEPLFGPPTSTTNDDLPTPSKTDSEDSVRVRWPAKRMSVGDMNKRVRALVEWVGREQASLGERARRRSALCVALREGEVGKEDETMRMMEELMSELIGFQERFGPGAKGRERRGAS
ncbi:unnamed protein product [Peniophora sp. CBMAI 1063]|nr:unnamed protein product [Peniophora sp. CBMAI 1063]